MARPNVFVVGAPRSATTSLYAALSRHPHVFMSPNKEPHHLSGLDPSGFPSAFRTIVRSRERYLELFSGAGEQDAWVGEASTSYLASPQAPVRILELNADAHAIAVLREPVERAWSHYLHDARRGLDERTFAQAVEDDLAAPASAHGVTARYVHAGFYAEAVSRYRRLFGDRLLALPFDAFAHDAENALGTVSSFLNLVPRLEHLERTSGYVRPAGRVERAVGRVAGRMVPRPFTRRLPRWLQPLGVKPELDRSLARELAALYRDDVAQLESMLDIRLDWRSRYTG